LDEGRVAASPPAAWWQRLLVSLASADSIDRGITVRVKPE
jgi:hypothetical protein